MNELKKITILLSLVFIALTSQAVTFTAHAPSKIEEGATFQIKFVLKNSEGQGFAPPCVSWAKLIYGPAVSESFCQSWSSSGGSSSSSSVDYTMTYRATSKGEFTVGPASITVSGKVLKSNSVSIEVVSASSMPGEEEQSLLLQQGVKPTEASCGAADTNSEFYENEGFDSYEDIREEFVDEEYLFDLCMSITSFLHKKELNKFTVNELLNWHAKLMPRLIKASDRRFEESTLNNYDKVDALLSYLINKIGIDYSHAVLGYSEDMKNCLMFYRTINMSAAIIRKNKTFISELETWHSLWFVLCELYSTQNEIDVFGGSFMSDAYNVAFRSILSLRLKDLTNIYNGMNPKVNKSLSSVSTSFINTIRNAKQGDINYVSDDMRMSFVAEQNKIKSLKPKVINLVQKWLSIRKKVGVDDKCTAFLLDELKSKEGGMFIGLKK
ncbi:MAG: BatD family protein [Muribaculaceae bacterium]|nr:BatD family protein [Muribaculaceae bacterium]